MDILSDKIELAKLLLSTNNPKIIESVKSIFKTAESSDFWDELSPEQQNEIKIATLQMENGLTSDYDEFISTHR